MLEDFFSKHAPFNMMQPEHQTYLASNLTTKRFAANAIITGPDDGVAEHYYIIEHGRVRGESLKPGSEPAWELVTGESFPIGALLAQRPVSTLCRAAEDTSCLVLERKHFDQLFKDSDAFQDFCTRRLASLFDQAMQQMQGMVTTTVSEDSSLNTPLRNLIPRNTISCSPDSSIEQALQLIENAQRRSIAIVNDNNEPLGILTLRDVMSRVTLARVDISSPISQVMTPLEVMLGPDDFAYEAALKMAESGIGHVCIVENGKFLGVVSERDLFSLQRVGLGNLSRAIQTSEDIKSLKRLSADIGHFTEQMLAQGASVIQLMRLITTLNDLITQRVIQLCETEYGKPDIAYTWIAFGSEGREEQTLKTDQDNGILFEIPTGETADSVRQKLLPLARKINEALAEVGFPLCPGNIMASNPECCLSLEEWQHRFQRWIDSGSPEYLLNASIFFDFRALYGDTQPVNELFGWLSELTQKNSRFRHQMAANALRINPPLGLIRDFVVSSGGEHPHTFDLKLQGVTPFVDAARIYALAHRINETNTIDRLRAAADKGVLRKDSVDAWIEAYQYIQLLRMNQHREQLKQDKTLTNHVNPDDLNELERRILKEAFRQARKLQLKISLEYQL